VAKQSLEGLAKKPSTVASAAKRPGEVLVYSKKVLPLQKRICIDKSGQEKNASGIQYLETDLRKSVDVSMKETNLLELSGEGKKLAVKGADSPIPVKDKCKLYSRESLMLSKKSSEPKVDVKQSYEECGMVVDSPLFDMKKLKLFGDTLHEKLSGKCESQGDYFDWNRLGCEIGTCFTAIPSHCTFAAG